MKTADFVATVFDGKSNPRKLTVAFTVALNALMKGHSAVLMLMIDAVELGQPGAMDDINVGPPFEPVAELLKKYLAAGGRIAVCKSCMVHKGLKEADMAPEYEIFTGADVADAMMAAKGSLQIA